MIAWLIDVAVPLLLCALVCLAMAFIALVLAVTVRSIVWVLS